MSTPENVQRMKDNPGIYIVQNVKAPEQLIVIWSKGGVLRAMSIDQVLSDEGWSTGLLIKHGPLS